MHALRTQAPYLETLDIHRMKWVACSDIDALHGYFPKLRHVPLHPLAHDRTPGFFGSLTSLTLTSVFAECEQLVDILQDTPMLRKLTLCSDGLIPCDDVGDFTVKTGMLLVARLPHLEEFYMSSYTASACMLVLSHLIIDQPVNLVLKCDLQNILSDRVPSAMNLVSRFLTANRQIVHRFAEIHAHNDSDDRDPSPSHFRFHDSGRCYPQYWHHYLPLGDVQTLLVHEDMFPHRDLPKGWEIRGLPEKFTSLQQVERLEIVAAVAWYLIPHFATTARSTDPTHPALFPRLKSIRLYLHETRRSWCAPENIPALCEDVFGVLESYLRERHEEGHPIEELGIHAPSGIIQSDELNARFRNLVRHLRFPYSPMETSCLLWKCDLLRFS